MWSWGCLCRRKIKAWGQQCAGDLLPNAVPVLHGQDARWTSAGLVAEPYQSHPTQSFCLFHAVSHASFPPLCPYFPFSCLFFFHSSFLFFLFCLFFPFFSILYMKSQYLFFLGSSFWLQLSSGYSDHIRTKQRGCHFCTSLASTWGWKITCGQTVKVCGKLCW